MLAKFDETLWCATVEQVTVFGPEDIRFTFKNGTEIRI